MIKLFRGIRRTFITNGETGKYLKYAIGEIFLVMVGILLALQVNNWNQDRKLEKQLTTILQTVTEDLKTDTIVVANTIRFYDTINKYSLKYAKREINARNVDSFIYCRSLVTLYRPMTIQKKGFKLLQNYSELTSKKADTLLTDLGQFYILYEAIIENNNDMIKTEVLENLSHFKKQSWFVDWSQGKMTEDMRAYFGESQDYRNRVVANNILATNNHQAVLKQYKKDATEILNLIEQRLEPEP